MKNFRIKVKGECHSVAIQKRLFELGFEWLSGTKVAQPQYVNETFIVRKGILSRGSGASLKMLTFDDLYDLPTPRVITIDGKDIELSEESFQAFKKQFSE